MTENDKQTTDVKADPIVKSTDDTPLSPPSGASGSYVESKQMEENTPSRRGIVLLGLYLLLMALLTVYLLGGLMMAETDEDKISAITGVTPTPSPTASPSPTATATPTQTPTPTPTVTPPANSNSGQVNTNTGQTNVSSGQVNSSTKTPTPTVPPKIDQNIPVVSIPADVYVHIPYFFTSLMSADSYLFLIVFFSGMLGSVIRGIYSYFKHIGLKDFSFNWTWFYILIPYAGAALALVIYFVIRGGFYGASFGKGLVLNLFSFAALGALTGLFSEHAMEKLRQVAKVLLADVPPKVENAKEIVDEKNKANLNKP